LDIEGNNDKDMPKEKLEDISNKIFINYQNRLKNFERLFYTI